MTALSFFRMPLAAAFLGAVTLVFSAGASDAQAAHGGVLIEASLITQEYFNVATDAGTGFSSLYNPRFGSDGNVYISTISGTTIKAQYARGAGTPDGLANNPSVILQLRDDGLNTTNNMESRMFQDYTVGSGLSGTFALGSGGAANGGFIRYSQDGTFSTASLGPGAGASGATLTPDSFDWIDDDTVIFSVYTSAGGSGNRTRLYVADIADSGGNLTVAASTAFLGGVSDIATGANQRIRNVKVGSIGTYAYYGDAGVNGDVGFFAMDIATGIETRLGTLATTGSDSYGLWDVQEVDGILYVHTTDDGTLAWEMDNGAALTGVTDVNNAAGAGTALGEADFNLSTAAKNALIDGLGGTGQQSWGFDVNADGQSFLLSAIAGIGVEIRGARHRGDSDRDNDIDGDDLADWAAGFGIGDTWGEGNFDEDADVDGFDFLILQRNFGSGLAPLAGSSSLTTGSVPEPTTAVLLSLGLFAFTMHRRRMS